MQESECIYNPLVPLYYKHLRTLTIIDAFMWCNVMKGGAADLSDSKESIFERALELARSSKPEKLSNYPDDSMNLETWLCNARAEVGRARGVKARKLASVARNASFPPQYIFPAAGGPISWLLKKQTIVALSICKAEYIAVTAASTICKDATWLRAILHEIKHCSEVTDSILLLSPIPMAMDNQSAVALTKKDALNSRTRHSDIKYHHFKRV